MPLDATLLSLLACPVDRQGLFYFEAEGALYNPRLKRRYAITNGVPVLLVDQATVVSDAEHERLLALAATHALTLNF